MRQRGNIAKHLATTPGTRAFQRCICGDGLARERFAQVGHPTFAPSEFCARYKQQPKQSKTFDMLVSIQLV
jgi:hypothetical protein